VNETFDGIESNAAIGKHAGGAVLFARGFKAHRTAKTDLAGYFALRTVRRIDDDDESGKQLDVRISEAADLVQRLHAASPHKTIGVLTRTNKAASRMLFEFSPGRRDLPASARGGGSFTDAPAVNAVLDLLRLADHPDDTVSAFNVARGPLGRVIEFNDEADRVQRHRTARRVRRMLLERGYAATITAWSNDLAPACDERQYRRLRQLIALADEFDRRPTLRTDDFVALAEARSAVDATPAPIQVMTVHQSKGLEFDIVVLPELDGKSAQLAGSNTAPVAMERDGVTGPITRVCRWVNETTRDMLPDIKPMFDAALQRTVRESLCLLYVAMTRARQGLYILIDPPNMTTKGASTTVPKTMAGVVRAALSEVDGPPEPEATLYERGDEEAMLRSGAMEDETDRVGPMDVTTPIRLAARNGRSMRGVAARPASALHDDDVPLRMKLRVQDDEARLRGSAIHKLFEQIEWLEEFDMDEAALVRFVRREAPRRDEAWARGIVMLFRSALERPDVKHLLSLRGRDPRQMLVHRERPFARLIDGRVQQGFVDRLVMETDGRGAARSAEVIDFKTDDVDADGLAAHAEQYRGQLETYRDVVTGAATLAPDQVGMTLLFVRPGVAIQL
jgi:ATP-dependent exoDNAse (exonuclease V) beta subunit